MGGVTFALKGKTESELQKLLEQRKREAQHEGLWEDFRTKPVWDPNTQEYKAILRVHT